MYANDLNPVFWFHSREVLDLVAAAEPTRDYNRPLISRPDGRKEYGFTNFFRQRIVFLLISERAGHTTTSGRNFGDSCRGFRQHRLHWCCAVKRLLMAVAMNHQVRSRRLQARFYTPRL